MQFPVFLFELSDNLPSVAYIYGSGFVLAAIVFGATYFHRQFGLMTLVLVSLICAQAAPTSRIEGLTSERTTENYINHWNLSCRVTFVLSVVSFFAVIMLKRWLKRKNKLN